MKSSLVGKKKEKLGNGVSTVTRCFIAPAPPLWGWTPPHLLTSCMNFHVVAAPTWGISRDNGWRGPKWCGLYMGRWIRKTLVRTWDVCLWGEKKCENFVFLTGKQYKKIPRVEFMLQMNMSCTRQREESK